MCITGTMSGKGRESMAFTKHLNKFRSVKIYHDIIHRINFAYLAEFFRFIGILVCEEIIVESSDSHEKTEIERNTQYDVHIYVGNREIGEEAERELGISAEAYRLLTAKLPDQTIFLCDFFSDQVVSADKDIYSENVISNCSENDQQDIMGNFVKKVFLVIFSDLNQSPIDTAWVQKLVDIYVEQKIWLHSMNLQYFTKRKSSAASSAKEAFLGSHERVKALLDEKPDKEIERFYRYAFLWCEVKVNTACDYNDEIIYFFKENISERCRRFCDDFPDFANAKVLLGLCYEPFPQTVGDALEAFKDALRGIGDECFAAPVHYWRGKRYEIYADMRNKAQRCYQDANFVKPKFRTYFKLAVFARNDGDYEKTIELFGKIIEKLKMKMEMKYADPLELEYLFKAYTQQCYAYHKAGKWLEAVRVGEKATIIKEKNIDENYFFDVFYGEEAEKYREILKERLSLNMVQWVKNNPI